MNKNKIRRILISLMTFAMVNIPIGLLFLSKHFVSSESMHSVVILFLWICFLGPSQFILWLHGGISIVEGKFFKFWI